jgi:preprotein translocase subunit SecB
MKLFPLQLKQAVIREVSCKPADGPEFAGTIELTANPTFGRSGEDPRQWQVTLSVHFKAGVGEIKPLQYSGHIEVVGIFLVTEEMAEEMTLRMVAMNCPSMLYATARDTVAYLTSRGPNGIFLLPTTTFSDQTLAQEGAAKPRAESEKEKAASKAGTR